MADAFLMGSGGGDKELQVVNITTSGNFTVPDSVTELYAWLVGGGGSGGSNGTYESSAGGGRGGGGWQDIIRKN